jgi:Rieske Fe-S protein
MASPNPPDSYRIESKKLIIDLNKHIKLKETGGWSAFEVINRKVIVIHPAENDFKAFENKCTHKGGWLSYRYKDGFMQCALHGSRFDTNGEVVRGPAQLPIHEFNVNVDKSELIIDLA